jgi:hypothetical protein
MTTPLGSPAWVRTPGITDYGSATDKADAYGQDVVNARTDVGAAALMRMADHLSACVRTSPFCVGVATCDDTTPGPPTISACLIMPSGKITTSYVGDAPPSGFPSFARNGNGDVTATFASSYTDAYGVSGSFAPSATIAGAISTSNLNATAYRSGQTVRFKIYTADTGAVFPGASFAWMVF